jgi:predicted glutamine amidotransferase
MCRLLLYFGKELDENILNNFLKQATHPKNTPGFDNILDTDFHLDGCGFAWFNNENKWSLIKYPNIPSSIPHFGNYNGVFISHLRNQGDSLASPSIENSHPFQYKDHIFCHNGKIFDFCKEKLLPHIDSFLIDKIEGQTDSETIFYLLLSFFQQTNCMQEALLSFHNLMNYLEIFYIGNFIWSDVTQTLICRVSNHPEKKPCSLYYSNNYKLFSSEPLCQFFQQFPEQEIFIIKNDFVPKLKIKKLNV